LGNGDAKYTYVFPVGYTWGAAGWKDQVEWKEKYSEIFKRRGNFALKKKVDEL